MKKVLFALLAVAALSSCSNEDFISQNQEAIAFGSPFVENSTRATDPSYSGSTRFEAFNVWGTVNGGVGTVAIFAIDPVSGTVGTGNEWTCTKKNYWVKDAKYNFAALANAGTVTLGADKLPATVTYTANQTDLVYAKSAEYTGKETGNELVKFTFNHLLSLVNFTVKNGSQSATGYSFKVDNIKISGASAGKYYIQADGTTNAGTWVATESNGYTIGAITVDNNTASADCGTALLVIPSTVTVSFDVTICVAEGSEVVPIGKKSYSKANITLAAGNSYNFVVEPKVGNEIKFNVENNPGWTTNPDITIE